MLLNWWCRLSNACDLRMPPEPDCPDEPSDPWPDRPSGVELSADCALSASEVKKLDIVVGLVVVVVRSVVGDAPPSSAKPAIRPGAACAPLRHFRGCIVRALILATVTLCRVCAPVRPKGARKRRRKDLKPYSHVIRLRAFT